VNTPPAWSAYLGLEKPLAAADGESLGWREGFLVARGKREVEVRRSLFNRGLYIPYERISMCAESTSGPSVRRCLSPSPRPSPLPSSLIYYAFSPLPCSSPSLCFSPLPYSSPSPLQLRLPFGTSIVFSTVAERKGEELFPISGRELKDKGLMDICAGQWSRRGKNLVGDRDGGRGDRKGKFVEA
jgi:hypothetical protein